MRGRGDDGSLRYADGDAEGPDKGAYEAGPDRRCDRRSDLMGIPATICKECRWPEKERVVGYPMPEEAVPLTGVCLNKKAPITNFVEGRRACQAINVNGLCPYFERRKER